MNVPYELKALLLPLLQPPMPLLLLMLVGAGLLRKQRWVGRSLILLGFAGTWLSFTEFGANSLQQLLLGRQQALDSDSIEHLHGRADTAILVLGGGALQASPEYGGPTLTPLTLERLRYGVWLARRTSLPLGYSGGLGWRSEAGDVSEAVLAQQIARDEWRQPLRWAEQQARDTRENASLTLPLLQRDGVRRLVLVTHAQHMPRAERAFRRAPGGQAIEIVPAPVGLRATSPYVYGDFLPAGEAIRKTRYIVYEWLGLLAGH